MEDQTPVPPRQFCGDLDIRIARDGTWYYRGSPIGRKELVSLFASVLRRDADGGYWLVTPAERGRIEVEDVPFIAIELFVCHDEAVQVISLRTNVDEIVTIDQDHPLRVIETPVTEETIPYVLIRPGLEARVSRAVYYELVALGNEERIDGESLYGVWSMGVFFPLGKMIDEG